MISKIIKTLNNNGVIGINTDTVCGLVGNPESKEAVEKCYKIKNRDKNKPLSIFLYDKNLIKNICETTIFIENFINNELKNNTIILKKKNKEYLKLISKDTIGIRIPNDSFIIDILKTYNKPIFATSINISGEKEYINIKDVDKNILSKLDLIVNNKIIFQSNQPSNIYTIQNNKIIKIR